jgi:hypothetical protein
MRLEELLRLDLPWVIVQVLHALGCWVISLALADLLFDLHFFLKFFLDCPERILAELEGLYRRSGAIYR